MNQINFKSYTNRRKKNKSNKIKIEVELEFRWSKAKTATMTRVGLRAWEQHHSCGHARYDIKRCLPNMLID